MLPLLLLLPLMLLPVTPEPIEWLDPATVTLPDTFVGEPVSHTFRFRNLTEAPVVIDNVRVGCGCTATEWQDTAVAPGETGSLTVTFDADVAGAYRKYVKVFFDGQRGGHKLWIEGFVENRP
ncbi:hypothetical protein GGR26_001217 [Lewinella marina]|uniref:DUF1573 domain-containing protein n=1 Tax=Neolewinella marina TaxID=438751 RepID=A0A2G0CFU9_9BACT|nr:DUF1573 domain-containing protein [Neolewinella marina]NJB85472.1 hypothetical protein [Neolewinella marina]PHK98838.1 hypothetical protein CGL56_10270 [Neolewinella marina]